MTAPFGIEFYSKTDALEVVRDLGQGKLIVVPPKVHPSFATYVVQATPILGVVWIKAVSATFENDAYGTQARQLKNELNTQLEKRYGVGKSTDFLNQGSIWNEPRDWAQGLAANERHCFVLWERPAAGGLPDDLASVFLGAGGIGGGATNIVIEYASTRMLEAEGELRDMLSDLL